MYGAVFAKVERLDGEGDRLAHVLAALDRLLESVDGTL